MQSILAGTATIKGTNGADWSLKHKSKLPDNYVTKNDLKALGWKRGKNISNYATGKLLTKGAYRNANGHLPQKMGEYGMKPISIINLVGVIRKEYYGQMTD